MANSLRIDLRGKKVVMEGNGTEEFRTVQVNDGTEAGFGALPFTGGTALFGLHVATGRSIRVNGMEVEKVVE